jgi:sugar phosphate isomerase/epimerase
MIEACRASGVRALEYHPQNVNGLRDDEITALRKKHETRGISINSFHLPFAADDDIASFYETQRQRAVGRMNRSIRVAGLLGARVVIQHPTTNRYNAEENGLDRYFEQLHRSLQEMLPAARRAGVVIGLENMTPGEYGAGRFFSEPGHFTRLSRELTDPNVGYVYDTGHALMSAGPDAIQILEAMGDRIAAWHLADNAGDRDSHLAPGHGAVDWDAVFRHAARLKFTAPVTMETAPWGHGPDYSMEAWRKSVQTLDTLVDRALGG